MDGNRRYGREKYGNTIQGHRSGGETLIDFIKWCKEENVEMLTVFAFSSENWNRDAYEINAMMKLFLEYTERLKKEVVDQNIRVKVLSTHFDKLPENIKISVQELEELSKSNSGFQLNVCLSYGSRAEITSAAKHIACDTLKGNIDPSSINEDIFSSYLSTAGLPEPDALIRTSGEYRLSNFLLWQLAYTEMFFVDKYWPALEKGDFQQILREFGDRRRRYGS